MSNWYGNDNPGTRMPQGGGIPEAGPQTGGWVPGEKNANGTMGFGHYEGSGPNAPAGPSYVPDQNLWGSHLDFGENHIQGGPNGGHDPNGFWSLPQFGGLYGTSNRVAAQYANQGDEYANRRIGDSLSSPYRMQQGATRGLQQDAYGMQMAAAQGQVPSSALIGQGLAQQANQEAMARAAALGGGAGAMRVGGAGALQAVQQGALGRAGEIGQANQGLLGQAAGIRGGDQTAFAIDNAREMQQAEMNQKMQLASQGMGNQIMLDQLGVDSSGYGARLGYQTADQLAAAERAFQTQKDLINGGLQAGAGLLSAYGSSGGRNGGGGY